MSLKIKTFEFQTVKDQFSQVCLPSLAERTLNLRARTEDIPRWWNFEQSFTSDEFSCAWCAEVNYPRVINQPDVQVRFGFGVGPHKLGWKRLGSAPHCRGEQLSSLSVTCHPFIILRVIVIVIIVIIVSMENVK